MEYEVDVLHALMSGLPAEVLEITRSVPAPGNRQMKMLEAANLMAENGYTNHEIILILEFLADMWLVLPRSNLYARYSRILGMVKNARSHHPGTGKHVAAQRGRPRQEGEVHVE